MNLGEAAVGVVVYKGEIRLTNIQLEKSSVRARPEFNMLTSLDRDQPIYIIDQFGYSDRFTELHSPEASHSLLY